MNKSQSRKYVHNLTTGDRIAHAGDLYTVTGVTVLPGLRRQNVRISTAEGTDIVRVLGSFTNLY